jgi:ankyrin repeat protein
MTTSYNLKQAPQQKISAKDALKAVREGDLETVQIFLTQEGINVNQLIGRLTLLVSAIKNHQFPIVQKLLAAKADCTAPVQKFLPLQYAIHQHQFDIIEALIEAKADINANNPSASYGGNLLFSYMMYWYDRKFSAEEKEEAAKMIKFLLQHKADPSGKLADKRECPFAFTMEINLGRSDIFEALIHAKADVNGNDMFGRNALRMAYQKKRYDLVRLLIDAGSEPTKVFTPEEMSNLFLELAEIDKQEAAFNEALYMQIPLPPELYPSYVFTPAPARSYVEHHDPNLSAYWKKLEVTKTPMLETIPVVGTSSDVAQPSLEPVKLKF